MEKLEATGAFDDIIPASKDRTEDGLHRVTLESIYTGGDGRSPGRGGAGVGTPAAEAAGVEGAPVTPARRMLREKRTLIWPIAIALMLNAALYAIVVYPLSKKVGRRGAGGRGVCRARSRPPGATTTRRRPPSPARHQADAELQKFYSEVLPPDVSGARRITFLRIEQLRRAVRPAPASARRRTRTAMRDSQLAKFIYTAALSGEYRNIRRFIHSLETAPEFLVLENVELSQERAGQQRAERHGADRHVLPGGGQWSKLKRPPRRSAARARGCSSLSGSPWPCTLVTWLMPGKSAAPRRRRLNRGSPRQAGAPSARGSRRQARGVEGAAAGSRGQTSGTRSGSTCRRRRRRRPRRRFRSRRRCHAAASAGLPPQPAAPPPPPKISLTLKFIGIVDVPVAGKVAAFTDCRVDDARARRGHHRRPVPPRPDRRRVGRDGIPGRPRPRDDSHVGTGLRHEVGPIAPGRSVQMECRC